MSEAISATTVRQGSETPQRVGGFTLWFTGLSSSGKTTIADAVAKELKKGREWVEQLDGDVTRSKFWPELGFSKQDRNENIRRVALLAQLLTRNGIAVVASFISPYRETRDYARCVIGSFVEIYVKCPLDVCIQRDTKGMYRRALSGEIKEFTGVSAPYEEPDNPEVVVETDKETVEESVRRVLDKVREAEYI